MKTTINFSKPTVTAVSSLWEFLWLVLKSRLRSKKHRIYVYSLLTVSVVINDETCFETVEGHNSSRAPLKDP